MSADEVDMDLRAIVSQMNRIAKEIPPMESRIGRREFRRHAVIICFTDVTQ